MPRRPHKTGKTARRAAREARPTADDAPREEREERDVKDRLVQTRVPRRLEDVLKAEAKRRRLSVSHLIEDTLAIVDTVVSGGEQLAQTSVRVAGQVARDAERLAQRARSAGSEDGTRREPARSKKTAPRSLDHVLAWNPVVLNRDVHCAACGTALAKGSSANLGVSQDASQPPAWLCADCLETL
jgi:hypothetical protein